MTTYTKVLTETLTLKDTLVGTEDIPVKLGIASGRVVVERDSTQIADIQSKDIDTIIVEGKRGEVIKWTALIDNSSKEYDNTFKNHDIVSIYLGWGVSTSLVLKGFCHSVLEIEHLIELSGYDYTDFLVGPNINKEYGDEDWGAILRDLIVSYSTLDASNIPNVGNTTGGRISYTARSLWEVINEILDEIDYDLKVDTDRKVTIYKRIGEPKYGVRSRSFEEISSNKDSYPIVNRVVITGVKEKLQESFDSATIRADYWDIESGEGDWSIEEYNLKYDGTGDGEIFSKVKGYDLNIELPIKQTGTWNGLSIFYRRVDQTAFNDGYELELTSDGKQMKLYKSDGAGGRSFLKAYPDTPNSAIFVVDTWYNIKIDCSKVTHAIYLDNSKKIDIEDATYDNGKLAIKCPGGYTSYIDYVRLTTNIPIYAVDEDTSSIGRIGRKEVILDRPEFHTRGEAERVAKLELARRKFEASRIKLSLEGTLDIEVGDILRFYLQEPKVITHKENETIVEADYLIIGIKHTLEGGIWILKLELAEIIPELETILASLRTAAYRKVVEVEQFKTYYHSELMPSLLDSTISYKEEINKLGGCAIGFSTVIE